MRRIVLFLMSTLTILVLLFGYHTSTASRAARGQTSFVSTAKAGTSATSSSAGAAAPSAGITIPPTTATTSTTSNGTSTSSTSSAAPPTTSSAITKATTSTITGHVFDTRWGPVQVQLTVVSGKIASVAVVQYPNGNSRDQQINATALPILVQETITAQSAKIDMVSGATVTSDGYLGSLQSALDQM